MKKTRILALLSALFLFLSSGTAPVFAGEKCLECTKFERLGFPLSYAERLCALSLAHPTWEWIPLPVTTLSREMEGKAYTFDYVIKEEYEVDGRSLVSREQSFSAYREEGSKLYDRGFYQASQEAVAYFMDPRNFLNEEDVFQFLLLRGGEDVTLGQVSEVLGQSAVKNEISGLEEKLLIFGKQKNVNPLFLAARLRQEQGAEGNPLLYGTAGESLSDPAFTGFYNIFNIGAYGTGEEEVYRRGAEYAMEMGWDTAEKSLEGGIQVLSEKYVTRYQDTLYLQKWNVDPRSRTEEGESRNFWAQFMQNIGAAKTESDYLREVLGEEENLTFLIPVYEEMPATPCADPAGGACPVFASATAKESPHRYGEKEENALKEAKEIKNTKEKKEKKEQGLNQEIWFPIFLSAIASLAVLLLSEKNEKECGKSTFFRKKS